MSDETKLGIGFFIFLLLMSNRLACGEMNSSDCWKMCGATPVRFISGTIRGAAQCICTESRLDGGITP